jgi:hypothetical protein
MLQANTKDNIERINNIENKTATSSLSLNATKVAMLKTPVNIDSDTIKNTYIII